jgi:hypothetical protein
MKLIKDYITEKLKLRANNKNYFYIEPLDDDATLMICGAVVNNLSYSYNKIDWITFEKKNKEYTFEQDKRVYFKGDNPNGLDKGFFGTDDFIAIGGNIMSLIYNDDFEDKYTIPVKYCFREVFNVNGLVDASDLELPATELTEGCYYGMFDFAEKLENPPTELPATTLAPKCYAHMFFYCKSLTSAPILPAMNLAEECYASMFYNCKELTVAPNLPAVNLEPKCYQSMFSVTKIAKMPLLPATKLAEACYVGMFSYCKELTEIYDLPATQLADKCYNAMFKSCKLLKDKPKFGAEIPKDINDHMFSGCPCRGKKVRYIN